MKKALAVPALLLLLGLALAQRPSTPSDAYRPELAKAIQKIGENDARTLVQHRATRVWVLGSKELFPGMAAALAGKRVRVYLGSDEVALGLEWIRRIPARETEVELCVVPGVTAWGMLLGNPEPRERPDLETFFLAVDPKGGGYLYAHDPRITGPIQSMVFQQFAAVAATYFRLAQEKPSAASASYLEFLRASGGSAPCVTLDLTR